jgi:hypothetical protein
MRTRTRLMNLPCHYSQAKSSVHRPSPSGRAWMPALLASVPTPRPRRLIPRGAGPTEPDRWGRWATHPMEGGATWPPKGPLGRDGPVGHGGASPSGVRGPAPGLSGCGGPASRSVRGRRGCGWARGRVVRYICRTGWRSAFAAASPLRALPITCCTSRSRTPPAARPRRNPGRRRSSPTRRSCRAGRPTSGRRRSARPGCSGTPAYRCRPG